MGVLADALRGGGKFINWDEVGQGTIVTGVIDDVMKRQARKYQSTEPDTWDDGTPKEQAVIVINTSERIDADDDGRRSVVVNLWTQQKKALTEACKQANVPEPLPGDTFAAVWTTGAGGARDPRQFAYRVTPGAGLAGSLGSTPAAAPVDPFAAINQIKQAAANRETVAAAVVQAPPGDPLAGFTPEQIAALAALAVKA